MKKVILIILISFLSISMIYSQTKSKSNVEINMKLYQTAMRAKMERNLLKRDYDLIALDTSYKRKLIDSLFRECYRKEGIIVKTQKERNYYSDQLKESDNKTKGLEQKVQELDLIVRKQMDEPATEVKLSKKELRALKKNNLTKQ